MGKRHVSIIIILCLGVALTLAACGGGKIKFGGPTDLGEGAAGSGVDAGDFHETPTGETPELLGEEETQGVDGTTTSVQTVCECPETTCTSGRRELSTSDRSKVLTLARSLKTYDVTALEISADVSGNILSYGNDVVIVDIADGPRVAQTESADGTIFGYQITPELSVSNIILVDGTKITRTEGAEGAMVVMTYFPLANTANLNLITAIRTTDGATLSIDSGTVPLSATVLEIIDAAVLLDLEVVRTTDKKTLRNEDGTTVTLNPEVVTIIKSLSAEGLMALKVLGVSKGITHTQATSGTATVRDDTATDRGDTGVTTDRDAAGTAPTQEPLPPVTTTRSTP